MTTNNTHSNKLVQLDNVVQTMLAFSNKTFPASFSFRPVVDLFERSPFIRLMSLTSSSIFTFDTLLELSGVCSERSFDSKCSFYKKKTKVLV